MLLDYALISILLVVGHFLRSRVRLLQRLFMPTPIIAGFLGLILGHQLCDLLPFHRTTDGDLAMASYPSVLISLLFATLFLGSVKTPLPVRRLIRKSGDTFFYNLASDVGQYAIALIFGIAILAPLFPELEPGFALMLPAGFVGGHGTATAMAQVFAEHGWEDSLTIGYTFATIGMLSGIVGGMLLINWGTRSGWTRFVREAEELPESLKIGLTPEHERTSIGMETVSPIALDPLAWHVALVLAAFGIAWGADILLHVCFGDRQTVPMFALAMFAGLFLQKCLNGLGLGEYVDASLIKRIGSTASDFLVAFGVASIKVVVVVENAVPLAIMSALGVVFSAGMFWLLGPRMFRTYWFERSLFVFGWNTGVVGVGVALLRVVDPRMRSGTLTDFGIAYVLISLFTVAVIVLLPGRVMEHDVVVPATILAAGFAACLLLSRLVYGWSSEPRDACRPGEDATQETL